MDLMEDELDKLLEKLKGAEEQVDQSIRYALINYPNGGTNVNKSKVLTFNLMSKKSEVSLLIAMKMISNKEERRREMVVLHYFRYEVTSTDKLVHHAVCLL